MTSILIPDPETTPHLTAAEAGRIYRMSLPTVYEQCQEWQRTGGASGIPSIRFGRKVLIVTALVRRQFGLDTEPAAA